MAKYHQAQPDKTTKIIVVTFFHPCLVGFLDFSYRISAVASLCRPTVVSREPIRNREEFANMEFEEVVFPTSDFSIPNHLRYILRVRNFLRERRPDMVIYLGSQLALLASLVRSTPSLIYWNEHPSHFFGDATSAPKSKFKALLRWAIYRGARDTRVVMPIGEAHRDDLLAHGSAPDRCKLLYMGVSNSFRASTVKAAQSRFLSDKLRLVYAGSVSPARGRDVMLEGLFRAVAAGIPVHLTLIGADEYQIAFCRTQADRHGMGSALEVLGRIPGHAVPEYLARSDLGLCLGEDQEYWRYNPPTKLFEYLVSGLPVLASRIKTHTQYIKDWKNGLIFDYSSTSFADALNVLWRNRDKIPAMSANAISDSSIFLWEEISPKFLCIIRKVLDHA